MSEPAGEFPLDRVRMRRERRERLLEAMGREGLDVVVALGGPNVQYASGAVLPADDSARCHYQRTVAVVRSDPPAVHVFTPFPDVLPPELPGDCRHPALPLEMPEGAALLARFLRELEPAGSGAPRVGVDEYTAALFEALPAALDGWELLDAGPAFAAARLCKTPDELECIRRAQSINEAAMRDMLPRVRPGVRQCELSAHFLRRIHELGAAGNAVDPIWQVIDPRLAGGPVSPGGDVPFPRTTSDRLLREGDWLWVDSGILYEGYASDFGRTWLVSRTPRPNARERSWFERWREVVAQVHEAVRPGATGLDLLRAARRVGGPDPWLGHFYLAHGVGLSSAEMPLVGTDLGESFDARLVLAPGMVLVLEPAIFEDGFGGYRAEEILAVTEGGSRWLSHFPYDPFEGAVA